MNALELEKVSGLFNESNHMTVFTGAGISVNSGIPDFRGEKGLYSYVKEKYNLPYPKAIFDISYFIKNPGPFFALSKELINSNIKPTKAHEFIAYLEEKGKLTLVITQNIDLLHQKAGSKKVFECHGSYQTGHCIACKKKYTLADIQSELEKGEIPYCSCKAIIKPDVVFLGESLPLRFYEILYHLPKTDLLLVFGSSLNVQPTASFVLDLAKKTKSILVNFSETSYDNYFSFVFHEDIDSFCKQVWQQINF
jgi:NAD-dependent SIR2 family protein deacetylase